MKLQTTKSGFTLIELLVVITIIGILATGAVSIYTSQIQKARDSTRITSMNALKASVEQVYQDDSEYPHSDVFVDSVNNYLDNFPADPKHSQPCNDNAVAGGVDCGYAYITAADANGILFGTYELSTAFENIGNITSRATADSGTDGLRLEIGIDTLTNVTAVVMDAIEDGAGGTASGVDGVCAVDGTAAAGANTLIIINGNPVAAVLPAQCG